MPAAAILPLAVWHERALRHRQRACLHTGPARMRRDHGEPHPIADFLFEYYPFPFALLENWHPGVALALEADSPALPPSFTDRCYRLEDGVIMADPDKISNKERQRLLWMIQLLEATRGRTGNFACHGLHEWGRMAAGFMKWNRSAWHPWRNHCATGSSTLCV